MENVAEPTDVLFVPRAVESERFLEFGNESRIDVALGFDRGEKIAGGQTHESKDEERDGQKHGEESRQAAKNKSGHGVIHGVQSSSRFQTKEPRGGMRIFFHRSFRPT